MKRKVMGGAVVLLSAILMAGCGNAIPEMSGQQQALFVEYTVGKVLKYDKNREGKLTELTLEEEIEEEKPAADPDETIDIEEDAQEEASAEEVTVIDNTDIVISDITMEEFLKLNSVRITYTGYETADSYPAQEGELYFAMDATSGNKLLVLKFLTENISGAETSLDIAQSNTRFKIIVNGEEKNALTTLLLNDLAYYQGTLAPGESTELVLICEIPAEESNGITSLALTMKNDETATISLY